MLKPIGALWKRENANNKWLSGKIEADKIYEVFPPGTSMPDLQILVFRNEKKTTEKQPDYRISLSIPDDQVPQQRPQQGGQIDF